MSDHFERPDSAARSLAFLPAVCGAIAGSVLWFLVGLASFGVVWSSTRWAPLIELGLPPTVPANVWQQPSPWNILVPVFGAILFGGLLFLGTVAGWYAERGRRPSAVGAVLGGWLVAVLAAAFTATVWAVGATLAGAVPTGIAWAFRSVQPQLLASGSFGLVWGWAPALLTVLVGTRMTATASAPRVSYGPPIVQRSSGIPLTMAVVLAVAVVTIAAGIGISTAQPAAARASRIAAGGAPKGLPATMPAPTSTLAPPPPLVAPDPVQPAGNWCQPEDTSLTVSATDGALGHRDLTLVIGNRSTQSCVVDGYPDVAFASSGGPAVSVSVEHGSSYLATDPEATAIMLSPGASAESHLAWDATGKTTNTAAVLWAATYPGAQRAQLPINTDIADGSTVSVTAWATPASTAG
jgi:Protein of unknown function (DUF4232)